MFEAYALQKISKKKIVELVVYNLPDRDCSAHPSDGELKLANGGEAKYKESINTQCTIEWNNYLLCAS